MTPQNLSAITQDQFKGAKPAEVDLEIWLDWPTEARSYITSYRALLSKVAPLVSTMREIHKALEQFLEVRELLNDFYLDSLAELVVTEEDLENTSPRSAPNNKSDLPTTFRIKKE